MDYNEFLEQKKQYSGMQGFQYNFMPDNAFEFQKILIDYHLMKGKSACFADTGLGKTLIFLTFAENIVKHTNKNVLILTPLAVSTQTISEGEKFGIEVKRSRDGKPKGKITVTNYQQLNKFDSNDFVACILDESGILKNFEGQFKKDIIRFMNKMSYRLLCTATPSPNDFTELGNSSEALGELKYMDMLSQFFRDTSNDKNPQWSTPNWILKQHAVHDFWRWVVSWARAIRRPSDLGCDDSTHVLTKLIETEHVLESKTLLEGYLFPFKYESLKDQREERKKTLEQRAEKVLELVNHHELSTIWADYNYETDYLEKFIPNAVQISGQDEDDEKEEKFNAFLKGEIKRIIIKPKIGAWGLNWQHCNHAIVFPNHSYEQYYQLVRRLHRFGQKRDVFVDIVTTEGEGRVFDNIKRKAADAEKMFSMLVSFMNNELKINKQENFNKKMELPTWLKTK